MPDWGFGLGSSPNEWASRAERTKFGIVLRGDKEPPSDEWLRWVSKTCVNLELQPHLIVQVERDDKLAYMLAEELGASITSWEGLGHAHQEALVRKAYRYCDVVVGDRLHGLIVAASEGAIPLAWTPDASAKAQKHFEVVGMPWVGRYSGEPLDVYPLLDQGLRDNYLIYLTEAIARARSELASVDAEVKRIFTTSDGRKTESL